MRIFSNQIQSGKAKSYQKGAASIIFVMLISLGITASSGSVVDTIKGSQEIITISNSVTHTQNTTWSGAEAFRRYLNVLGDAQAVSDLNGTSGLEITLSNSSGGTLTANNISVQDAPDPAEDGVLEVSADIMNFHSASKSSSAIQVIFHFKAGATNASTTGDGRFDISFASDLNLEGGLQLYNGGSPIDLSVDGDLTFGGVSVNAIGSIETTGSVTLNSGVETDSIYSNGDVELNGSSSSGTVQTLGKLTTNGGAQVTHAFANDDILIAASRDSETLRSVKSVTVTGSADHGYIDAGETITVTSSSVDTMKAVGDIDYSSWNTVGDIVSMSDVTCVSQWWRSFDSISANGTLNDCTSSPNIGSTIESGASNIVAPMAELEPYVHGSFSIDVWLLRETAHYIFEYDEITSRIKVTISGLNGVSAGEYFIGDYIAPLANYKDYTCKSFATGGNCIDPGAPLVPVCLGESLFNNCIEYDEASDTFTFTAVNSAPGVMFFDGNLHLQNGHAMSTFLVSGSITTSGNFEAWAPNYGGYDKVCNGHSSHVPGPVAQRYTDEYSVHYPSNFCDTTNASFVAREVGNVALVAGGYNPADPSTYVGGNISLGSSSVVVGGVLAGNNLTTSGDTTIHGLVSSTAQGEGEGVNRFGGSTNISLESVGEDYTPTSVPIVDGEFFVPQSREATTVMQWVRPL